MDSDPTPGDLDEMNRVRDRYRSVGDQAEVALNFLKKGGQVETGRGDAMDKLRSRIDDLPDKLQKTVDSFHDAADAYTTYGPKLVEAQDLLDKAMDQALEVSDQARQSVPALADGATDQQKSDAKRQQDQIDQAQDKLTAAKDLAQQAKAMRETAQRACADVLDKAAGEAIPERNVFQKIADFFKDFPFVQILLGALIAITAIFFPVVGALLGAGLFLFNTVVAAKNGTLKLGDLLVGIIGILPGAGLLKLGAKAGQAVGAAVKSVPVLGGLASGAGKAAGALGTGVNKVTGTIQNVGQSIKDTKVIGGALNTTAGQLGAEAGKKFAKGVALDAFGQGVNVATNKNEKFNAGTLFAGAAAGAVAGTGFKGAVGAIGKARGSAPNAFGSTHEPQVGDTVGKRAGDQFGGLIEESAVIGGKVGATAAQGGDVQGTFAVEATNSAGKLAVGPVGKAHANSALGGLADKIPIKGSGGGASAGGAHSSPSAAPTTSSHTPNDPANTPLPPSPTTPTSTHTPNDPANTPLPPSPTTSTGTHTPNDPANTPLPPSPTTSTSTHTPNDPANTPLPPSPTTSTGAGDGPAPQRPETTTE
ncbi:hypothetical protein PV417_17215 [Streptomyces sp. ME19-03-3]|nr:hypothetical protein [Streptomyces sp. ME19-03-3]